MAGTVELTARPSSDPTKAPEPVVHVGGAIPVAQSDAVPTYRTAVDPEISGVVTPEISVDAAGSGFAYFVRATVNPGDDVTGATRLLNGYPGIDWCLPGETISIRSSVAITDVYLVGVISGTTYTSTAYGIGLTETDLADALAEQAHFTFDEVDNVREVVITVSPTFTSGQLCRVKVQGVSHA